MSDSIDPAKLNVCPVCGAALSDVAGGLCPRCLLADAAQPTSVPGTAAGSEPPSQAEVTGAFPQFEIIELIGAGGMGTVWRARQPKLNRHVALKLLPASLAERDPAFAERFEREGQLLARLHHPNIVTVHDSGRAGNFFYLVMEFVDGVNLRQAMRASRFTAQQALTIVPKICDALQYAHEEGVLHRDIKPENILLDAKGRVKLADFGIAKLVAQPETAPTSAAAPASSDGSLTLGDATLGTPNYMAPEQIDKPADVDHRADIYSLGVVFYELLTGELPLGKFAPPSEKSAADPRLDGIVQQALEKERERRQQSVGEMRTQVETVVSSPASSGGGEAQTSGTQPHSSGVPISGNSAEENFEALEKTAPPRFSRSAIVGACWVIFFFAVVPAFIAHELETHEFWRHGPFASVLGFFVWFVFVIPAFIAPLGATLLGYIAVSQIHCSAGKLHGLGLAVFDGLFFPLLVLDAVIGRAWVFVVGEIIASYTGIPDLRYDPTLGPTITNGLVNQLQHTRTAIGLLAGVVTVVIVDYLIIRRVWRAVNPPSANFVASAPATPRQASGTLPSRFSRTAIWGALWIVVLPVGLAMNTVAALYNAGLPAHDPMRWIIGLPGLVLIVLGQIGFLGTTILGWIAVTQIRRSAGRLCGLGLAVFDGLLFPLLALDALIIWADLSGRTHIVGPGLTPGVTMAVQNVPGVVVVLMMAIIMVVDFLIIRTVWRAVNRTAASSSAAAPAAVPEAANSPLGYAAMFFAVLSAILGSWIWSRLLAPSSVVIFSILICALLGVLLALPVRRTGRGKQALLIGSINAAIWLILALAGLGAHPKPATAPRAPVVLAFGPVIERVLPFDRSFIDFQSGRVMRPDWEKVGVSGADWEPWIQQTGADAMVEEAPEQRIVQPPPSDRGFPRLVALSSDLPERRGDRESCVFVSEETDGFDSVRPNDADARLKVVTERDLYWGLAYGERPWWFKTRDGAKGVLQILGTSDAPRGLKIRYKLVQSGETKADAVTKPAATDAKFSPAIERALTATDANRDGVIALRFKNNEVVKPPVAVTGHFKDLATRGFTPELKQWMHAENVDLLLHLGEKEYDVLFLDMRNGFAGQPTEWDTILPDRAASLLAQLEKLNTNPGPGIFSGCGYRDGLSSVNVFRTRDGLVGYYQLRGLADVDGHGVNIRYKLVQSGATRTDTITTPAFGPVMERVLPSGVPCREQYFQFRSGEVFVVGNGPGTSGEEAAFDENKIEDAGGVDMSAGSSEDQIHIAGRGCIFTRDVEELKWDSFSAEQAVYAIKRVRFVDGIVTPTKKELPITYLFKTARGEVGLMEVMGVVNDQRDGWNEKGMKFRYKLVQGTGTTTAAAPTKSSLVFGPETRGLQAAIEVTPGEPFKLRIHIRNVSDRGISIEGALYRHDDECLLADAQGQLVPVTKVPHDIKIGMKGGYFSAGQVAVFESAGLSFQDIDKAPASAGYVAKAKPGRYTLRFRIRLPGDDVPFAAGERAWKGELETGPVTIEVKDPSTQSVTPAADSTSSAILGPMVERTVNDLQTTRESCALNLDSGKLLSVPANFTLNTLTNPSTQPEAVAWARDNQVDAVAFVTSNGDKIVKCGLLCPGLVVLRANNKEWNPDSATPQDLKEQFDEATHKWQFIPQIAEVTGDDQFPANYLILDTRSHRRGVLQIMGVADSPRSVKIRYRLVEGAAAKKTAQTAQPTAPIVEAEVRFYEMPDDAPVDLARLATLKQQPGVKLLFAPSVTMFSGQEAEIAEASDAAADAFAPTPTGATARLRPTLDGETVHYAVKLSLRVRPTPDDGKRTTVQELSHSGDAPLDQPVIVDLGRGDKGHRLVARMVFHRGTKKAE